MTEEKKGKEVELEQHQQAEPGEQPEPDKMDELLADVPEWLRGPLKENYKQILAALAIVIVTACLWSGYSYYTARQESSASYHLGIAMAKHNVDERIKELKDLQARFSHTNAAHLADLLIGQAYLEKGDWNKAEETFASCASDFGEALADSAVMGLGYAAEGKKSLDQALGNYKKAENNKNGFEAVAVLDRARVLAEKGKKKDALKAYDYYLDLKPKSPFLDFIRYQILKLS